MYLGTYIPTYSYSGAPQAENKQEVQYQVALAEFVDGFNFQYLNICAAYMV